MVVRNSPSEAQPQIPLFFAGKSVFVTGATGFMGKVLIERLLYTCPNIGLIYLLMREKKEISPDARLLQMKQSPVFDVVRQQCPRQLDKLRVLCGDTARPQLGMSQKSIDCLKEVQVVFNVAATLKFDEELCKAVDENVRSVMRLLDMCDSLPDLKCFIHVSTGYCMSELSVIEEKVYPPTIDCEQLCSLTDTMAPKVLAGMLPHLLGDKPNTYTFTKAIAETAVAAHQAAYPIAIFRPTIVISAIQHPYPGWIENLNGPSGVVVAGGKGVLHSFLCLKGLKADLLPVDLAIDTLIATAWYTGVNRPQDILVYNCSTIDNPITWGTFQEGLQSNIHHAPFDNPLWYPCGFPVSNKYAYKLTEWVLQTIPLHLIEYVNRMMGVKKPMNLIKASNRLRAMSDVLSFFTLHEWEFKTDNFKMLRESLSPADAAIYNLDPMSIEWNNQMKNFVIGTRRYLLKERDEDIEKAKKQFQKKFYIHMACKYLLFASVIRVVLMYSPMARTIVYGALKLFLSMFNGLHQRLLHSA